METNLEGYFERNIYLYCTSFRTSLETLLTTDTTPVSQRHLASCSPFHFPRGEQAGFRGSFVEILDIRLDGTNRVTQGIVGRIALELASHGVIALVSVGTAIFYFSNIPSQWGLTFLNKFYQYLSFKAKLWVH